MVISAQTATTMVRQMMREQSGGVGKEKGKLEEKENMKKCGECSQFRGKSVPIQ